MLGLNGDGAMASAASLQTHRLTIEFVDDDLPNLDSATVDWDAASVPTDYYNCMGFAVGFNRWWTPPKAPQVTPSPADFWPPFISDDDLSVETFVEAAET